jgi:hypothetical protein
MFREYDENVSPAGCTAQVVSCEVCIFKAHLAAGAAAAGAWSTFRASACATASNGHRGAFKELRAALAYSNNKTTLISTSEHTSALASILCTMDPKRDEKPTSAVSGTASAFEAADRDADEDQPRRYMHARIAFQLLLVRSALLRLRIHNTTLRAL